MRQLYRALAAMVFLTLAAASPARPGEIAGLDLPPACATSFNDPSGCYGVP